MGIDLNPLSPLFDLGGKLIDEIFPDKTAQEAQRAQAQIALLQLQQQGEFQAVAQQLSVILAEANSADPWTSRSRPAFLYVMYVMILSAIPMGILYAFRPDLAGNMAVGLGKWLNAIPDSLWALFGAGYLGYTGFRSWDKKNGVTK